MDKLAILSSLVGKIVRIDRGGPESRVGRLLAVKPDHLVIYCEGEGIVYYKNDHIKSISIDERENIKRLNQENMFIPPFLDFDDFTTVLKNMTYRWVQINRGGPERLEGVLTDANDERILLVVKDEIVSVFNFHVRNISYLLQNDHQASKDEEQNKNNGDKNKEQKSSNKKKK
jgi:spore coat protein B